MGRCLEGLEHCRSLAPSTVSRKTSANSRSLSKLLIPRRFPSQKKYRDLCVFTCVCVSCFPLIHSSMSVCHVWKTRLSPSLTHPHNPCSSFITCGTKTSCVMSTWCNNLPPTQHHQIVEQEHTNVLYYMFRTFSLMRSSCLLTIV
jgi:hypothetical protein